MADKAKARAMGINHVALEVGDIEEALAFFGGFIAFELRGKGDTHAFIDLGDQFLALMTSEHRPSRVVGRHFGLVVDDKQAVVDALEKMGVERLPGGFFDFLDPWGNRIEIVGYEGIQFTKAAHVLEGMGLGDVGKTEDALRQLADKGMAPK